MSLELGRDMASGMIRCVCKEGTYETNYERYPCCGMQLDTLEIKILIRSVRIIRSISVDAYMLAQMPMGIKCKSSDADMQSKLVSIMYLSIPSQQLSPLSIS